MENETSVITTGEPATTTGHTTTGQLHSTTGVMAIVSPAANLRTDLLLLLSICGLFTLYQIAVMVV